MTLLMLLPGVPARGEPPAHVGVARNSAAGYKHLTEQQRAKLMDAIERRVRPPLFNNQLSTQYFELPGYSQHLAYCYLDMVTALTGIQSVTTIAL